jgi:GNAT superfamily N-acetyltransferase
LTNTDNAGITVRAIELSDLDRINLRCWPDRPVIDRLLADQGTIGMAAWEGETCVGQLHCYRLSLPQWRNDDWPAWNAWWLPTAQPESAPNRDIGIKGLAWAHACCHVGRTLVAAQQSDDADSFYFGKGIGTALCRDSIQYARTHGYVAVLAAGAPAGLMEFPRWTGHLPWTTYAKLGFRAADTVEPQAELPGWARGDSPPDVMVEVKAALSAGRPACDFHDRLMVLDLSSA